MLRRFLPAIVCLSLCAQPPNNSDNNRPAFEAATIRRNTDCTTPRGEEQSTPGRMSLKCVSIRDMIRIAWGNVSDPEPKRLPDVYGGPAWLNTDFYDVTAKAAGNASLDQMYGPMTKALLENRLRLKLHDEIRQLPVYTLTVAKSSKLTPAKEGSCIPIDMKTVLQSPPPPNYCGRNTTTKGATIVFDGHGMTIAEFINRALRSLDRPVIDHTGLRGRFDLHVEFAPPELLAAGDSGTSIFTALPEQTGMKLTPSRGPVEVHVIDSIERPTEN